MSTSGALDGKLKDLDILYHGDIGISTEKVIKTKQAYNQYHKSASPMSWEYETIMTQAYRLMYPPADSVDPATSYTTFV